MTQYDHIATGYRAVAEAIPYRGPEWYSLYKRMGNLKGLSVLDLGCGDGMSSRRIKSWGAARVTGVDISIEMIRLARQTEFEEQLGIDYVTADVAGMGSLGAFDIVTTSYLLHYARTRSTLNQMVQSIYDNLKPGQLFIGSNLNPQLPPYPSLEPEGHQFIYEMPASPLKEGATIHVTLLGDGEAVTIDAWWHSWDTYQEAFRRAGFRSWALEPYLIPEEETAKYPPGFWDSYIAAPWVIQFICSK
ncbi:class I SAM-dependent methyltransferase [Chitinophaga solisilvae]|uniref:Class I SAM-dependent methyltransferase n=1 Tax=Chitinophaga solisilvae TaxID=1233460 RepID=A0A433WG13_9BACT|nr:class I SAM-dependent methyltransferase [Chitinophaga solisilvae]NSL86117.1 class I SAM-dependent methyltransferase [Chitinophaga solisilvae]